MNFSNLARRVGQLVANNSPGILTAIGVAGTISTAYIAARASLNVAKRLDLEAWDELTGKQKAEIVQETGVWKEYIPAAGVCLATIACIVASNRVSASRAAGLAAAFTLVERADREYRDKVVEKFGPRKEEELRGDILRDHLARENWEDDSVEVHGKPVGEIFKDDFSDRYVWTNHEELRARVNDLNKAIVSVGHATLADFYYLIDMPAPAFSYNLGWNANDPMMELRFATAATPGGKPVHSFEFNPHPTPNYERFH